jgi:hypothetical protein
MEQIEHKSENNTIFYLDLNIECSKSVEFNFADLEFDANMLVIDIGM